MSISNIKCIRHITLVIASCWSFAISSQTLSEAELKTYIKSTLVTASPNSLYEYNMIYGDEIMPQDINKLYGFEIGRSLEDGLLIFSRLYNNKRDIIVRFDYILDIRAVSRIVIEEIGDFYDLKIFMQTGSLHQNNIYSLVTGKIENKPLINGYIPISVGKHTNVKLLSKAILDLRDALKKRDEDEQELVLFNLNRCYNFFGRKPQDILVLSKDCEQLPTYEGDNSTSRFKCSGHYSFCAFNPNLGDICFMAGFEFPSRFKTELVKNLSPQSPLKYVGRKEMPFLSPLKYKGTDDYRFADVYDLGDSISYYIYDVGATGEEMPGNCLQKSLLFIFNKLIEHERGTVVNFVQMVKSKSGTYEVPVTLNGVLKINFIFDSGASDLSIPSDIAETLFKTNTITEADYLGTQKYVFADGSTETCKVYNIRSIEIGDVTVKNVRASISNISAPLLLGQSVLQRFGKYTIDNKSHIVFFD